MACLPYPTFLHSPTQTPSALALSSVGRVRIHPLSCPGSAVVVNDKDDDGASTTSGGASSSIKINAAYQEILAKTILQSQTPKSDKESKQLRKKYMKQSVAMTSSFLSASLGLDVSIVDVEMVLSAKDVVDSDGCLACCFLDAGCAYIVIDTSNDDDGGLEKAVEAVDTARLPKERLILHFDSVNSLIESSCDEIDSRVATVSVAADGEDALARMDEWNTKGLKWTIQLTCSVGDDVVEKVAAISKACKENAGSITLVDPTAEQLGLSYATCMKTDRGDGLYTTVVSTRSGEALGLVYSSKVSDFTLMCNMVLFIVHCLYGYTVCV